MEKVLYIQTTGTSLYGFVGYVKEKESEKVLRSIRNNYSTLLKRHGDTGRLIVNISVYNPELPYRF